MDDLQQPPAAVETAARALVRERTNGLCDENWPEQCDSCDCFHAETKAATGHGFSREMARVLLDTTTGTPPTLPNCGES